MNSYAFYNGKFGKRDEIEIPLSDRALFFGDAIYDAAIGSYDRILWEEEHIDRFLKNAAAINIDHPYTKKHISQLLREIAVKSMLDSYFIYFQLSRNLPHRCHSAIGCTSNLLITIDPLTIYKNPTPLKLITFDDQRHGYCHIKTVNLLAAVLSMTEAEASATDEAVFIKNNVVTECSKSNISIIKQGRVISHPKTNEILPGIAREHLSMICKDIKIPFDEKKYSLDEMLEADEILVTSTTKLCRKVSHINGLPVGNKAPALADNICNLMYKEYADYCLK